MRCSYLQNLKTEGSVLGDAVASKNQILCSLCVAGEEKGCADPPAYTGSMNKDVKMSFTYSYVLGPLFCSFRICWEHLLGANFQTIFDDNDDQISSEVDPCSTADRRLRKYEAANQHHQVHQVHQHHQVHKISLFDRLCSFGLFPQCPRPKYTIWNCH